MSTKNDYQSLKNLYDKFMYVEERNKKGHIIIDLNEFNKSQYKNKDIIFFQYSMFVIFEALEISKKNNNINKIIVHVNMVGTTRSNFSFKFFKRVNTLLEEAIPDEIMEVCYVYSKSKFVHVLWKLIYPILHEDSRDKFKIINLK
ncbi:MAG: hypothetical protein CML42_06815 [Rhodobacteraceae bacterium]|nr:hypothetical protein [Paracoccaceae bacterium]|tara:strand:- start:381 stop:815 length:435 start_codon:yes stop_codon:yes gene_type:complete